MAFKEVENQEQILFKPADILLKPAETRTKNKLDFLILNYLKTKAKPYFCNH